MSSFPYRYVARIVVKAESPLSIGSGLKGIETDSLVALDANGLPYIPGTSLAGVLRHAIEQGADGKRLADMFFGCQDKIQGEEREYGHGSYVSISDARMIGKEGQVLDGLQDIDFDDEFYAVYKNLPVRQHVKISDKGVAVDKSKFDEQVVVAGSKFCFEIEMLGKGANEKKESDQKEELSPEEKVFNTILSALRQETLRLGGGTRRGFGKMSVESISKKVLNLDDADDRNKYIAKPSSLSGEWDWDPFSNDDNVESEASDWIKYQITLVPENFFLFGAGYGDDEADQVPVKTKIIEWDESGKPEVKENLILIPATSVKGAIAHRVAYHYNRRRMHEEGYSAKTGEENDAVKALFGYVGGSDEDSRIGKVIISDIVKSVHNIENREKLFNHVAVDRFTGGAIDGALFSEKAVYAPGIRFELEILVDSNDTSEYLSALEDALDDLITGMLPLGGGVNKGYGAFMGEWTKIAAKWEK